MKRKPNYTMPDEVTNCVYVIESGGLFKIGISRSLQERLKNISMNSPARVSVAVVIKPRDFVAARDLEKILHRRFESKRSHGEWFALDHDDIDFIRNIQSV